METNPWLSPVTKPRGYAGPWLQLWTEKRAGGGPHPDCRAPRANQAQRETLTIVISGQVRFPLDITRVF